MQIQIKCVDFSDQYIKGKFIPWNEDNFPTCSVPKGSKAIWISDGSIERMTYVTFICPDDEKEMINYPFYVYEEGSFVDDNWKSYCHFLGMTTYGKCIFVDN